MLNYWQKFLLSKVINTFYAEGEFKTIVKNVLHFSVAHFSFLFPPDCLSLLSSQVREGGRDDVPFFFFICCTDFSLFVLILLHLS